MEKVVTTNSAEETAALAAEFLDVLVPASDGATIVALQGDLGAGKTTFTQALARHLGVGDTVTSPTFVIEKVYDLPRREQFDRLIHIDSYRLNQEAELVHLGWPELISEPRNLIVIEWPENVGTLAAAPTYKINFGHESDTIRRITITPWPIN